MAEEYHRLGHQCNVAHTGLFSYTLQHRQTLDPVGPE